jgi:hypothetical protein
MATKKESGVVHFTIGEDFGKLLTTIAQEHLIYANDPIKALKTITDGLIGIPVDMALKVLKGDLMLMVDTETQEVVVCSPDENPEYYKTYPKVNVLDFMERQARKVTKGRNQLLVGWNEVQRMIRRYNKVISVTVYYEDVFKFIAGNDKDLLNRYRESEEVESIKQIIEVTKAFILKTSEIEKTMRWMMINWKEFDNTDNFNKYQEYSGDVYSDNMEIMLTMQQTLNMDFEFNDERDARITTFIESMREIEETISKGIEPVNIMDNWSAGWLSPDCKFYGLNGEIANMLHNQIASALQEADVIPMYENERDEEHDMKINPDAWLEQHGWVKIHGNNINYAGCLNHHLGKENVHINEQQVMLITEYIRDCHKGVLKLGWKMQQMTPTMFLMYFKQDLFALNKKFFEY